MNKIIIIISLLAFTCLFRCDPACSCFTAIQNNSNQILKVIGIHNYKNDSLSIQPDSQGILNQCGGICSALSYRDNFEKSYDSLLIFVGDSLRYLQAPLNKIYWKENENINKYSGGGSANFTLIITNDSLKL